MAVDKPIVIAYPNFKNKIHVDLCYQIMIFKSASRATFKTFAVDRDRRVGHSG